MGNYTEHWFFGLIITSAVLLAMHYFFGVDILNFQVIVWSAIAMLVFSILPDIDHKSSYISGALHVTAAVAVFAVLTKTVKFNFIAVIMLFSVVVLQVYHIIYAKEGRMHRQFPHSFTFGILSSGVFFLASPVWIASIIAFTAFFSHLLLDVYIIDALKKDIGIWKFLFSPLLFVVRKVRKL